MPYEGCTMMSLLHVAGYTVIIEFGSTEETEEKFDDVYAKVKQEFEDARIKERYNDISTFTLLVRGERERREAGPDKIFSCLRT